MTPKTIKYVDQKKQDNFSCKHENTLKSMEFSEGDKHLCLLTVARPGIESISDALTLRCRLSGTKCSDDAIQRLVRVLIH